LSNNRRIEESVGSGENLAMLLGGKGKRSTHKDKVSKITSKSMAQGKRGKRIEIMAP